MAKVARFAKGSGVFTCQCCNRQTRATNRDHASTGNCEICYELAGIENGFSDYGAEEAFRDYGKVARELLAELESKGGSLDNWQDLIAELAKEELKAMAANVATITEKAAPVLSRKECRAARKARKEAKAEAARLVAEWDEQNPEGDVKMWAERAAEVLRLLA